MVLRVQFSKPFLGQFPAIRSLLSYVRTSSHLLSDSDFVETACSNPASQPTCFVLCTCVHTYVRTFHSIQSDGATRCNSRKRVEKKEGRKGVSRKLLMQKFSFAGRLRCDSLSLSLALQSLHLLYLHTYIYVHREQPHGFACQ